MIDSPMLSAVLTREPCWPMMATPKIDGWWCEILNGEPRTRSGGTIINDFTRAWLSANLPEGFKFELQVGANHDSTASAMRRVNGRPDFRCFVFDYVFDETDRAYVDRIEDRNRLAPASPSVARRVHFLEPRELRGMDDLLAFEAWCVAEGYEGAMLNAPDGLHKSGRSTEGEGFLVKVKRVDDGRETAWEAMRRALTFAARCGEGKQA